MPTLGIDAAVMVSAVSTRVFSIGIPICGVLMATSSSIGQPRDYGANSNPAWTT